ncbi:MAG: orotidine 5'-phosphate decarboxylase [Armatimonadetes bacterium]|nr:orotidine 5'-phosphate decarboxylase [Armatimonadota bacterium]
MVELTEPTLQVALDFVNLSQALRCAREAYQGGARWIEAGTPLIKSEGLEAVRRLRDEFPDCTIIADMKTMDAGRVEVETAAQAGADIVTVMGNAADATIAECIEAGQRYDALIMVDLLEVHDPPARAREAQELGAALIGVHCPIDVQMRGGDPFEVLRQVVEAVDIPVAVAGGINSETAPLAVEAGAMVVIVGGAIIKSPDAADATRKILQAMRTGKPIQTELYKRGREEDLRQIFGKCTAANVSDAMHRRGWLPDIRPIAPGLRCVGPAVTVWTYPGDWAKPVEAIDVAPPGSVLVIDVLGQGPAVWGEEASKSCVSRGVAGVVINGACRDTREIRELGFPVFSRLVCPQAGDPKGMGMIGVTLKIGETVVRPGDWIIADDDGVVAVPREKAVEIANRALAVVERESREKAEIEQGRTLAEVSELQRWEQRRRQLSHKPREEERGG